LRYFAIHPIRAKKIKLAVGSVCELCGRDASLDDLEIHTFRTEEEASAHPPADWERFLLILCTWCHWDLHAYEIPIAEQEAMVDERPQGVRCAIREILAHVARPYTPPDTDLEQLFLDTKQITR
jgi:hypothetical protein